MRVGKILSGESIFRSQTVEIRHGGISDYVGVAVIFLHHQNDVAESGLVGRNGGLNRKGANSLTTSAATEQN